MDVNLCPFCHFWIGGGSGPTVILTQFMHDLIKIYTNHCRLCISVRNGAVKKGPYVGIKGNIETSERMGERETISDWGGVGDHIVR